MPIRLGGWYPPEMFFFVLHMCFCRRLPVRFESETWMPLAHYCWLVLTWFKPWTSWFYILVAQIGHLSWNGVLLKYTIISFLNSTRTCWSMMPYLGHLKLIRATKSVSSGPDEHSFPKTRMHSSRMRTARSSGRPGGVSTRHTPLGADPPGSRHPPGTRHPPPGPPLTPPPVNRMTDACENITLPQLRCGR